MIAPRKLHRWLALGAIIPGLIVLLSGAGLSFAKEIDRFMQPSLLSVAASGEVELVRLHSIITEQLLAKPHWRIGQVRYPQSPYDPITLAIETTDSSSLVYLNPHTGKFLGQRSQKTELAERLRRLHVELISPSAGQGLAVFVGLVLVMMIVLGICLARVAGRWRLHGWHARLGLLISPILFVIVGSGLLSVYGPGEISPTIEPVNSSSLVNNIPQRFFSPPDSELLSVCPTQLISVTAVDAGLSLRCKNGTAFKLAANASIQDRTFDAGSGLLLWRLHSGDWAGLTGRGIWMWSVLAVLYLLYSGVRDWRHRKMKKT